MKIISMKRGQGKTTFLIKTSCFSNIPIVCANKQRRMVIEDMAKKMEMTIPTPIMAEEILEGETINRKSKGVLIDDLEDVLSILFKTNIGSVTTSCGIYDWR